LRISNLEIFVICKEFVAFIVLGEYALVCSGAISANSQPKSNKISKSSFVFESSWNKIYATGLKHKRLYSRKSIDRNHPQSSTLTPPSDNKRNFLHCTCYTERGKTTRERKGRKCGGRNPPQTPQY
jgi:hypothetical protein